MKRPAELAAEAADAVRNLNHATLWGRVDGGWEYPSDAYDVIGELQHMAMRTPQALQQAGKFIDAFADEGRLGVDAGGTDVAGMQADLSAALEDAIAAAAALTKALTVAHNVASHLTYRI
ncbi:hypothetical protein [Streptomyces sp. NPDC005093]